ncbi:hypothetical protein J7K93_09190 [bacterium]|nr:hypothetical protein [bacterium]
MNKKTKWFMLTFLVFTPILMLVFCTKSSNMVVVENNDLNQQTFKSTGGDSVDVPEFVDVNYIELDKIHRISKFRSAEGHDYSDDFESCRSMKHYFWPDSSIDWAAIKIFSPVSGTVVRLYEEWAGTQVQIQSSKYPKFIFTIFHINLVNPLHEGDSVTEGQQLGTHIGSQTMSDIAVGYDTSEGYRLVSYFQVMTDALFLSYKGRGVDSRDELIISKEARDADPLGCNGETFSTSGTLENWVTLNSGYTGIVM